MSTATENSEKLITSIVGESLKVVSENFNFIGNVQQAKRMYSNNWVYELQGVFPNFQ